MPRQFSGSKTDWFLDVHRLVWGAWASAQGAPVSRGLRA